MSFPSHLQTRILAGSIFFLAASCNTTEPPPPKQATIALIAKDASSTEAWLKATTTEVPATVRLLRDGQRTSDFRLQTSDSILLDEGLLPRHTYTYQLQKLASDLSVVETSASVQVTTMDTTSHNFTFEIDTLGDGNSSVLYDVAIINDTLAYAVGAIYKMDSLGNWDPNAYNMAKWNGVSWQLMRIQFYTFCGQPGTGSYPAKSIFAFSSTDIWIGMDGSQVVRWNGQSQAAPMCTPVSINKLWGENSNSMYAVGNGGGIAHYNGTSWQRLESGATLDIRDIWGASDPRTDQLQILALASTFTPNLQRSAILEITGNSVTALSTTGMSADMFSIWFVPGRRYYAVGAGIHQKRMLSDSAWRAYPSGVVTRFFSGEVRGQDINDVFVVGSFGEVVHFNGQFWFRYFSDVPLPSGYLGFLAIKGNLMMATGQVNASRGIVLIGRR